MVSRKNFRPNMRFDVSLVVLMGILTFSVLLFLLALNKSFSKNFRTSASPRPLNFQNHQSKKTNNCSLKDPSVDFELTVPVQLKDWLYKTGYVKSPVDETLANQYVQILVPVAGATSNNFEDQNKNVLTFRKFAQSEWDKLEKGCQKENQFYCETAGTKIDERDGSVWAYTKNKDCPKDIEAKCSLAEKIIESFKLK